MPQYWYKSGCVTLTRCTITLRFTSSSSNVWLPFLAKNNITSSPACTALTQVSHRSHNVHTANHHLHGKREKSGIRRRTKVSFGRTMMQALELLRLAKGHISGRSNAEQWRTQTCSYSHYRVTLVWWHQGGREGVIEWVSQSVSQTDSQKIQLNREFLTFHSGMG